MVEIRDEFEVSTRSSIFPESNRVGSLTIFVNPNSPIISMSLLCLAAVCELVEHIYIDPVDIWKVEVSSKDDRWRGFVAAIEDREGFV